MVPRRLSGGRRRRRPTARPLTDGASLPSSPATPADVVDTTRPLFDPPADAGLIVTGCTRGASIRATGALRLAVALPNRALLAARQTARGVFPSASGHGNISPSCIPREASDRKKDTSRQYIAAMYSNNANHGKNRSPCIRFAVQNAVREYIERKTCRQGALFSSEAPKSCIARISCHPRRSVPPRHRYSPYRTRFLATPVAPHPSPSASQSAAASALPAPCVSQFPPPVSSLWPHGSSLLPRSEPPCRPGTSAS